ncbi:MAG: hypothetical protein NW224_02800 [Leptolyngbyaceae cyanobacterium bins.302]|nr:hypothetical protein [Leptolyngbyaceae cyanobacterium bins.302]
MNKTIHNTKQFDDEIRPEYDFAGGVRGKHYQAYRQGHSVTIHHADGTTTVFLFSSS